MKNTKTVSREYKLLLDTKMFFGNPEQLVDCSSCFWSDFCRLVGSMGIPVDGALDAIKSQRSIRFYDSQENRLRQNSYLFRERIDVYSDDREVTLKYRHPDRYLTQDRNMDFKQRKKSRKKFEQDIKVPFMTLFSYASKQRIAHGKSINKMNDPGRLFPGLAHSLDEYKSCETLVLVNAFTALEIVLGGAHLLLGKQQELLAECALIVWYNLFGDKRSPVLVEFSYRYRNNKERYSGYVSQQAYNLFLELQGLDSWIDSSSFLSKTEYVYSLGSANDTA